MTTLKARVLAAGLWAALAGPAWAGDALFPPTPTDAPLTIRIDAPIQSLVRQAKRSTEAVPARLSVEGRSHPIALSARGKSRRTRGYCDFPPLRVRFDAKPEGGVFAGEKSLKLVTHCKARDGYRDNMRAEFAAYRLQNRLDPNSLRVRYVEVDYADSETGKVVREPGFFIEDTDDAARRQGGKELDVAGRIRATQLDADTMQQAFLFHYLIGNTDFSLTAAAGGADCCHNTKLVAPQRNSVSGLIPISYDFDNSGFVDAPYAEPAAKLGLRNVRQRKWRGYCAHNPQALQQAAALAARRGDLMAELNRIPGWSDSRRKKAARYLETGLETLGDPGKMTRALDKDCRG